MFLLFKDGVFLGLTSRKTAESIIQKSEQPGAYYYPEIKGGNHTGGWALNESEQRAASIPETVSNRQGMLALIEFDHIDTVESMIASIEDDKQRRKAQAELNAPIWHFNSPFLRTMWFSIPNATATQLENLFIYANQQ